MAITEPYLKYTLSWLLYGVQPATSSFYQSINSGEVIDQTELATRMAVGGDIGAVFASHEADYSGYLNADCTYEGVTARSYTAAGVLIGEVFTAFDIPGSSEAALPPQSAVVVTLLTPTFGRSGRGRMYLPLVGIGVQANGMITAGNAKGVSDATAGLFNDLSGLAEDPVSVASFTKHNMYPVNRVHVDTVVDTQRRRRDQLVSLVVTPSPVTGVT